MKLKDHPLKIISDYDECLQPVNPFIWHKLTKEQGWNEGKPMLPFEEWFKIFWEKARMESQDWSIRTKYTTIKEIEELKKDKEKFEELVRKPFFKILDDPRYYE